MSVFNNDATQLSELMATGQHLELLHHCFGLLLHISNMVNHEPITDCLEQYEEKQRTAAEMVQDEADLFSENLNLALEDCLKYLVTEAPVSTLAELIEVGLPLCIDDSDGRGLVHHAASADSVLCLKMMIDSHVDVDVMDVRNVTPLMVACRQGSVKCVDVLLEHTNKLNHHDVNGETALHYACKSGVPSVVRLLLEKAIGFRTNNQGETELMIALSRNSDDIALMLIEFGIDVSSKNRQQSTMLHYAAKFDCPLVVKHLLEVPIQKDNHGYTPFAVAAKNGHHRTLKVLLESKPDRHLYDVETMTHNTPLQLATMMGNYECVDLLLNAGATIDYRNCLSLATYSGNSDVLALIIKRYKDDLGSNWHFTGMDSVNKLGMSPLHVAAMYGHEACVRMLTAEGANPSQCMPITGETPLMLTTVKNFHSCAKIIIHALCSSETFGLNFMTSKRKTALHYAATQGAWECVQLLIKAGAALDIKDCKGYTPLLLAVENGHLGIVKLLLAARCDVTLTKQHGWNGLHLATKNNDLDCVRCLLDAGLSPDSVSWMTRVSPINIAAEKGYIEILRLLLDSGASHSIADVTGLMPLHQAAKNNHVECIQLLVLHLAPTELYNEQGHTPAILAAIHGSIHALAVLILYNSHIAGFDFSKLLSSKHYVDVIWLLLQTNFRLCNKLTNLVLPPVGELSNDQRVLLEDIACDLVDSFGSLKQRCRIAIRHSMGRGVEFINGAAMLPLPRELQRYIAMEDECARYGAYK